MVNSWSFFQLHEKKRNCFCRALKVMAEIQKGSQAQVLCPTPRQGRGSWWARGTLSLSGACAGWDVPLLSPNCLSARNTQRFRGKQHKQVRETGWYSPGCCGQGGSPLGLQEQQFPPPTPVDSNQAGACRTPGSLMMPPADFSHYSVHSIILKLLRAMQ